MGNGIQRRGDYYLEQGPRVRSRSPFPVPLALYETHMPDWEAAWQQAKLELQQTRDELRLKMHLAKKDAKDELDALEAKYARHVAALEQKRGQLAGKAEILGDVAEETLAKVAEEIREGLAKLRERLKQT